MTRQSILEHFFKRFPKTGRIKSVQRGIFFPIIGLIALVWFFIRVIPKPSRLAYPCMKVTFPLASGFVVWIAGLFSSAVLFHHAGKYLKQSRILIGIVLLIIAASIGLFSLLQPQDKASASIVYVDDPYGPNNPIGEAKGINPGRVVWLHNPDATNENCKPNQWGDGYFLDKNCNQSVVDSMLSRALLQLTDAQTEQDAWDAVFRYFNKNRGKGDVGYKDTETIFIKINSVHGWTCESDGSIKNDYQYGYVDTSPQAILAMLRQLINKAGVPQENIYIADPLTHLFKHCLEKWQADFPNVHYMDKGNFIAGRERLTPSKESTMFFSDRGTILNVKSDKYYAEMDSADYLLNIPAMKAHGIGGVTFFAKNFFGAHTRSSADHMHKGLHGFSINHEPTRTSYGMYRVMVDLLGHENLGGKILIFFMDGLWGTSFEHEPPVKFQMAPFNNDWSSSIFLSQDPVALASVCMQILQEEFPKTAEEDDGEGRHWDANFPACDDYLHQAADAANWPQGIIYDPENDGTPLGSLGVHEHWNNAIDKEYTRNLGTGNGIELVKLFSPKSAVTFQEQIQTFELHQNYPNPFNPTTTIFYSLARNGHVKITVRNILGQEIVVLVDKVQRAGSYSIMWNAQNCPSGLYFCHMQSAGYSKFQKMLFQK